MTQPSPLVDRSLALRLLFWQLIAGLSVGGALWLKAPAAAYSAWTGAAIALVANGYFVVRAFFGKGRSPQQVVQGFYRGEAGKFVITVLLFALVFMHFKQVQAPWLLTGFILALLVAWILPLVATLRDKR